jgi:hypothetical protein
MRKRMSVRGVCVAVLALAGSAIGATGASATATVIYNNTPEKLPPNVVSQAFEATQLGQFGGQVEFAGASATTTSVSVVMSSWACQEGTWNASESTCKTARGAKFAWPITLHIYSVGAGNAVGTQIAGLTKTFKMPYRPTASAKCTGSHIGGYYAAGACWHGKAFRITFPLRGVTLPKQAIISVSYNTSGYGPEPQGYNTTCAKSIPGCFYDSLNVGLTEPPNEASPTPVAPSVGANPAPEDAYQDSQTAANYCDKGLQGTGVFRLDSGLPPCWTGYQPLFKVTTG